MFRFERFAATRPGRYDAIFRFLPLAFLIGTLSYLGCALPGREYPVSPLGDPACRGGLSVRSTPENVDLGVFREDNGRVVPRSRRRGQGARMLNSVLVVEDDAETREYFAEVLRDDDQNHTVETAGTLREALVTLHRQRPDVLLVDLGLPDGNGLDLIRTARHASQETSILVITVFGDESSVIGAIEAGAQGYLLKSEAPADLRESVHQVLSGGAPISPGIASHLLRRFREAELPKEGPHLTRREREVLGLMVKGLPLQEAADILGVTRNTVAGHVKSIYSKLEVKTRGEAVYEALSQGLVRVETKL